MISRSASILFASLALLACGRQLDLGSDVRPGCEGASAEPSVLTSLAELPDFTPLAIVIVGDSAYVGGISYPGRVFDAYAKDVGRLVRVPLGGGPAREVWRGTAFRGPLKVLGTRVAFVETDPNNVRPEPTFAGVDVYDTTTSSVEAVPNLPGRDYVIDFEIGVEGVVFSSGSLEGGATPALSGYSIARWADATSGTRSLLESPTRSASFLRRGEHVLAQLPADGSMTGYDDAGATSLQPAVFTIGETSIALERRFSELPAWSTTSENPVTARVTRADDVAYYVASRQGSESFTQRIGRVAGAGSFGVTVTSGSWGDARFEGDEAVWVPFEDRSMLRRRKLEATSAAEDAEVAFDPRRHIEAFDVGACQVAWISASSGGEDAFRVMLGPRR